MIIVIIGAGVVGLACAALARKRDTVIVLERHKKIGQEISSRNSGVIHAGLYYPTGSLKEKLCRRGRKLLYEHCQRYGIAHRKTGKLIVATTYEEMTTLEAIIKQGQANGAGALQWMDKVDLVNKEMGVRANAAIWSPETGIVDVHALMQSFQIEAEQKHADIVCATELKHIEPRKNGWLVHTESLDTSEAYTVKADVVINAAGLNAHLIAKQAGVDIHRAGYDIRFCKGDYFSIHPSLGAVTQHLLYPVPTTDGLGIHITFDMAGQFRLGPDTEFVDRIDYQIDSGKKQLFADAVRRFWPQMRAEYLSPDYAGIRPKRQSPEGAFSDFIIGEASTGQAPGLINLIGIESPGLTAALAIAEYVQHMVVQH